jgi:SAM-dependent methyltransferase
MLPPEVRCPICAGAQVHPVRRGLPDRFDPSAKYSILRCRICDLRFTHPFGFREDAYPPEYGPHHDPAASADHAPFRWPSLVRRGLEKWRLAEKHQRVFPFRRRGALLDIGSGAGAMLAQWARQHRKAVGIEPDPDAAARARAKGLDVRTQTIEQAEFPPGSFDAVTMSHVLEHVERPDEVLRKIARFLAPEGELIIWIPNFRSLVRAWWPATWFAYEVPRHLWHFDDRSIRRLLDGCGFVTVQVTPVPDEGHLLSTLDSVRPRWLRAILRSVRFLVVAACFLSRRPDVLRIRAVKAPHAPPFAAKRI